MRSSLDDLFTPAVIAVQEAKGAVGLYPIGHDAPEALDASEVGHITASDSFYMATVSESGWPYVQHNGPLPPTRWRLDGACSSGDLPTAASGHSGTEVR
jgi:hypothetical protein